MAKTILKVMYLAFAAVLAVVIWFFVYQSNRVEYITTSVKNYIKNEEYVNIGRLFGGLFDSRSSIDYDNSTDGPDMVVYPSYQLNYIKYYKTEEDTEATETYYAYEKAYNIYIFKASFNFADAATANGIKNYTAIRFYGDNDKTYDYYFKISKDINNTNYKERPTSPEDALLYHRVSSEGAINDRNLINDYTNYSLFSVILDSTRIEGIKKQLGSNILSYNIINNAGDKVLENNVNMKFDFSEEFYTITQSIYDAYGQYITAYLGHENKTVSDEDYNNTINNFNQISDQFTEKLKNNEYPTIYKPFTENEVFPGSLIWKTIGVIALYLVVVAIVYILLFKFSWIKRIIFRDKGKQEIRAKNVRPNSIDAKVENIETPKEDNKK